jgi:hypothetical protein
MKVWSRIAAFGALGALLALAACGRSMLQTGERAEWRHQAEATCMQSGAVKVGAGVVQLSPIEGPGVCGADFPLKVAALGAMTTLGYGDDMRPPAGIPNSSSQQMPRWPLNEPGYGRAPASPPPPPIQNGNMRWVPGPQGIAPPGSAPPAPSPASAPAGRPVSLYPPGVAPPPETEVEEDDAQPDDIPDDAVLPQRRGVPASAPRTQPAYIPPPVQRQPQSPPPLGPARGPERTASIMPAVVTPPATLSCPIVSALERWVTDGVQPAALHWFGQQVVEIKQISAYSCRGMVGAGTSHISEHAFGNALDVAGFVLADGRKIMVQNWRRGSPEEQGFLHDVQLYACQTFNTVLAPGYNAAHYNHIHVDLMRRSSGRRPCRPEAIPGEVAAAKARGVYASKQRGPAYTGSIPTKSGVQDAIPGEDGLDDDDIVAAFARSDAAKPAGKQPADDDTTGSIGWPRFLPEKPARTPRASTFDDRLSRPY